MAEAFAIRTASAATRSISAASMLREAGEAPGAIDEDAHAEPLALAARPRLRRGRT